jgi:guanylate kinase|tara:strand:- start:86 stop:661 length:576 start_codon:yes stop_codon:yes gene_type:complete
VLKSNKIIVVSGVSGSGKTTLVTYLLSRKELNLEFSISACSRPKRPSEIDGKDYIFLSNSEFQNKILQDEFLEWEEVYTNHFYGTLKASSESILNSGMNILFDVDVKGALSIKEYFKERARTIYIQPPTISIAKKRLIERETESKEDLNSRIKKMEEEAIYGAQMDCQVLNDDLDLAKDTIYNYVKEFLPT